MGERELKKYWELFSDVWNMFRQICKFNGSEQSWEKIINIGQDIVKKHDDSRLCKDLVLAIEDEFERRIKHE